MVMQTYGLDILSHRFSTRKPMVFVALTYGLRFSKLVFPCTAPSVSICVSIIVLNCKRLREKNTVRTWTIAEIPLSLQK